MRILLVPDKFRGSFSAAEVCSRLERGLRRVASPGSVHVDSQPLADGGEGTMDVLLDARGGIRVQVPARGPFDEPIEAEYGVLPDGSAVIEAAAFCGLGRIAAGQGDPLRATSAGLGDAIAAALDAGVVNLLIGLGGTATVDGGVGMARALGYRFEDSDGRTAGQETCGLSRIHRIDATEIHTKLQRSRFLMLCDVDNPLLGPQGAARVFGPQKGATPEGIRKLEMGLAALARSIRAWRGRGDRDPSDLPGAGAAGGLGAGAVAFLGAVLTPGAEYVMRVTGIRARMASSDLVVTGEGSFDGQSTRGKVTGAVLSATSEAGARAIVVAGRWDGTRPSSIPGLQVLTGQDLPSHPSYLKSADLEALGALIAKKALK